LKPQKKAVPGRGPDIPYFLRFNIPRDLNKGISS